MDGNGEDHDEKDETGDDGQPAEFATAGGSPGFKRGRGLNAAHIALGRFYAKLGFRLVKGKWVLHDHQKRVSLADTIRAAESRAEVEEIEWEMNKLSLPARVRRKLRMVAERKAEWLDAQGR